MVRQELREQIAPALGDPQTQASLQMIDHVLSTIAVRAQHEVAWMVEETAALCRLGHDVLAAHPEANSVAAALAATESMDQGSLHYDDVAGRYSLASRIRSPIDG